MTHAGAKAIADALPGITRASSLLVRAIAWLETRYGDAWPGTNNWGAIIATPEWTGPTETHEDSSFDPAQGAVAKRQQTFRVYFSPEAGALGLWDLLRSRRHARAVTAAEQGRWQDVSYELRMSGYYEGTRPNPLDAIADHQRALYSAIATITAATGEPNPLTPPPLGIPRAASGGGALLVATILALVGGSILYWWLR